MTPKRTKILPEHLEWIRGNEQAGRIFLSGPTETTTGNELNGLTMIEAASREAAEALVQQDSMIRSGAVTYSMHTWSVNVGRIALTLYLFDQSASLG